jgi:hypothetical protein
MAFVVPGLLNDVLDPQRLVLDQCPDFKVSIIMIHNPCSLMIWSYLNLPFESISDTDASIKSRLSGTRFVLQ